MGRIGPGWAPEPSRPAFATEAEHLLARPHVTPRRRWKSPPSATGYPHPFRCRLAAGSRLVSSRSASAAQRKKRIRRAPASPLSDTVPPDEHTRKRSSYLYLAIPTPRAPPGQTLSDLCAPIFRRRGYAEAATSRRLWRCPESWSPGWRFPSPSRGSAPSTPATVAAAYL